MRPRPIQQGGIPFWIAGGGEKVTLRIAAKYASYTNFNGGPEAFAHKSEVLRGHTDKLGRDFASITRSANFNTVVADTEAEVSERLDAIFARVKPFLSDGGYEHFTHAYTAGEALVGTVEQVSEKLAAMQQAGMGYAIHYFPEAAYDLSGVELFEQKVIPAFGA